jgi:hypothetical protein
VQANLSMSNRKNILLPIFVQKNTFFNFKKKQLFFKSNTFIIVYLETKEGILRRTHKNGKQQHKMENKKETSHENQKDACSVQLLTTLESMHSHENTKHQVNRMMHIYGNTHFLHQNKCTQIVVVF